jgi:hypothetical protein
VAAAVTIAADSTGDNQSSVSSGQTRLIIGLSNHYGSESGIPRFRSYFGSMPSFIKFTNPGARICYIIFLCFFDPKNLISSNE